MINQNEIYESFAVDPGFYGFQILSLTESILVYNT